MGKININLSNMKLQDIIKQLLVVVLISLYGCSDFLDPKIDDNYNDETVWRFYPGVPGRLRRTGQNQPPQSLGLAYFREER